MGALYQGRCFTTDADAARYYWSAFPAAFIPTDPVSVVTVNYDGTNHYLVTTQNGVTVSSIAVPSMQFAQCNPVELVADGSLLAFSIVGIWIAAFSFNMLRKVLGR